MKTGSTFNLLINLDVNMDYVNDVIFTIKCGGRKITKTEYKYDSINKRFEIELNQEDTVQMGGMCQVEAQINFTDNSVAKSEIKTFYVNQTLATKIIEGNQATTYGEEVGLKIDGLVTYGGDYILPVAKPYELGGVMPVEKTENMTQDVGVDQYGRLYTSQESTIQVDSHLSSVSKNPVENKVITEELKSKLDKSGHTPNKILATDAEGNVITKDNIKVDSQLSAISTNPVENKAVTEELNKKADKTEVENALRDLDLSLTTNVKNLDDKISENTDSINLLNKSVTEELSKKVDKTEAENTLKALDDKISKNTDSINLLNERVDEVEKKAEDRTDLEELFLKSAIKPTTEKDTFLNIQDSAAYKVLDFGMEGKTEQKQYSGKNLCSGGDVSGTQTVTVNIDTIPAGTYIFSANVESSDTDDVRCIVHFYYADGSHANYSLPRTNRASCQVVFKSDVVKIIFYASTSYNNGADDMFSFTDTQIEAGSVATSYEPYTGNQPSPNPDYPQEIVNAGEIYNLLNPEELISGLLLDENGNISESEAYRNTYRTLKQTLPAGTYTLFINGSKIHITRTILNGVFTNLNALVGEYTFVVESESEIAICFRKEDSSAFDGTEEIQLNAGANTKTYKPYTGRYEIICNTINENWFDGELESGTIHIETGLNVTNPGHLRSKNFLPVVNLQTYTVSHDGTIESIAVRQYDKDKAYIGTSTIQSGKFITTLNSCAYIRIAITGTGITKIMINLGKVALPYTPHQSQPFTLTSDRALTKWDKLVKRDGVWGWSINSVGEYKVTGTENFVIPPDVTSYYTGSSTDMYFFQSNLINDNAEKIKFVYSSDLSYIDMVWSKIGSVGICNNKKQIHMRFSNSTIGVSDEATREEKVNAYKSYLQQRYEDGNPVVLQYRTDTEQAFHPLPDSEQALLNNLETYYGTTNVMNDQGCPMWLTYVADTKLYIDNKINSAIASTQALVLEN